MKKPKPYFTKIIFLNKYTKGKTREELESELLNIEFSSNFMNNLLDLHKTIKC